LGGTFVVSVRGVPAGLGSGVEWDRRLDARLGAALLSIPGIKGVEIGEAFAAAALTGSAVHDPIDGRGGEWRRPSNRAGGIEGGMSNGEEIVIRGAMKPIPTLGKPLPSFDVATGRSGAAHAERSDVCAVAAACVVGEAMVAWVLGGELVEQFGGDTVEDLRDRLEAHRRRVKGWML
jgi:chorismate synthase